MQINDEIVTPLEKADDADLRLLLQQNMPLSTAIFASMPALATDASYEPFSKAYTAT